MNSTDKRTIMERLRTDLVTLEGLTPKSASNLVGVAKRWWLHCGGRPFDPMVATLEHAHSYLDDLDGTSDNTRQHHVVGLRRFYRFAGAYALCDFNPVTNLHAGTRPSAPAPNSTGRVIDEWERAMQRRGLAAGTISKRVALLRRWWKFAGDPFDLEVTWRTVERFIDAQDVYAANSRYAMVSHLHQFYRWARRYDLCTTDPTDLVERPRTTVHLPRPIHDTDLAVAVAVATGPMRAAILLAAGSGLRCVELARLRWVDVSTDSIRVHGKGDKERVIPLHPAARDALDDLDRADEHVLPWRPSLMDQRNGADGGATSRAINAYLHSIGVTATAHQLRHWCATQALRSSGDLRSVQDLLGHASPATTAIYTRVDASHLADIVTAINVPMTPANLDACTCTITDHYRALDHDCVEHGHAAEHARNHPQPVMLAAR